MSEKSILLISRLPLHGSFLCKLLSLHYDVVWIGNTTPFKLNPFNAPYILLLEFWKLVIGLRKAHDSLILIQYISLDGLLALMFKRIFGIKVVLFAVGSDVLKVYEHRVAYPLIRKIIINSDFVFCASTLIMEALKRICNDDSKTKCFLSVINVDDFEYYDGPKEYDIITVGTLDMNKNHLLLLDACKQLSRSVKVSIIGKGPMHTTLKSVSEKYELNVSFSGEIAHRQVYRELQKSRVYVHTAKSEGLPVTVLEAIFSGLPVILLQSPYVYDIEHRYGLSVHVVESNSAKDLANSISEVLQNYENEKHNMLSNKQKTTMLINEQPVELKNTLDKIYRKI